MVLISMLVMTVIGRLYIGLRASPLISTTQLQMAVVLRQSDAVQMLLGASADVAAATGIRETRSTPTATRPTPPMFRHVV